MQLTTSQTIIKFTHMCITKHYHLIWLFGHYSI